jgi:hypothetical protein
VADAAPGFPAFAAATRRRIPSTVVNPPDVKAGMLPPPAAALPDPAPGLAAFTATARPRTWSMVVNEPDVETGIRLMPVESWPAGRVRLFAARTAWTWSIETPVAA